MRLVGSNKTSEGTVEVCYYNNWGIISDQSWDDNEAQVVCRQLGYSNPQSMCSNKVMINLLIVYILHEHFLSFQMLRLPLVQLMVNPMHQSS